MTEEAVSEDSSLSDVSVQTEIRQHARNVLAELQREATVNTAENISCSQACRFFDISGFLHCPNFCDSSECAQMKQHMAQLVEERWDPKKEVYSFGTNGAVNTARGDYFLESADQIHFFAEPVALQEGQLRPEYANDKLGALNKVGHGLHLEATGNPFADYTRSSKIRNLVLDLGWQDPVVPQSMYIFKSPKLGGVVSSHQDSTFLYTTPRQTCLGLWLALDDATLNNGCLWVRPKSHVEPVRRQYRRNPAHFGKEAIAKRSNTAQGDLEQPKFVMDEDWVDDHGISWDGSLPENGWKGLLDAGFIPIECKAGDLLVFRGTLDHLSLANTSREQRHTFQLHLVEGPQAGVEWSASNWLQTPNQAFLRLRDDSDASNETGRDKRDMEASKQG